MTALTATPEVSVDAGRWRIWARRPGFEPVEVTWVRDVPTQVTEFSFTDPYGPQSATLLFPAVTMYDRLGVDELFWLAPEVDFDIEWSGPLPAGYPLERWVWEGYSLPFEYEQDQMSISLVGALLQMDDVLAKPEYASQPMPYEVAIARCWRDRVDLRIQDLQIQWPTWWSTVYTPVAKQLGSLTPTGVPPGAKWTGLLTRETGSWDKTLTSYIQSMLATMYTARGRWTLDLLPDRRPVLLHRDFRYETDAATVVISPTQPGITPRLSEDWSQSANVWYGQAKSVSGEAYSGMQVIGDGQRTVYRPLAAMRQVHPVSDRNTWLEQHRMRREQLLQVPDGLQADELIQVGVNHLQASSDPGLTGTIELKSDPRLLGGALIPRHLIRAGMTVQLPYFKGQPEGVLLHVTEVRYEAAEETMMLTVDSKYRDKITVEEVRRRGADALNVPRMLITGRTQPLLPDNLMPWNYADGSGYIPSSPTYNARRLFEDMPREIEFPYQEWTTQRPPRSASWRTCYIPIGPRDANKADNNWAYVGNRSGAGAGYQARFGFPVRMAQAGSIRSVQLAAYNADGEVMRVPFHFSIYYQRDVNVASMPKIPAGKIPFGTSFHTGDHYPFFDGAWDTYSELGVQRGIEVPVSVATAGLIRGWGSHKVPAGYWPGYAPSGDVPTGLLVDEDVWEFNTVGQTPHINPYAYNDVSVYAGYLYVMVYCDRQIDEPVYFMGRMFRVEPGSQA